MHTPYLRCLSMAALIACGDGDGPGDTVEPSAVRASDLYGYWLADRSTDAQTVLGFFPPARAPDELRGEPELPALPDGDVAGVWISDGRVLAQLSTYTVEKGRLHFSVLADISSTPGTTYENAIASFTPGTSMVVESKQSASGFREYTFHERCPVMNDLGWYEYAGTDCAEFVNQGAAMIFDRHGNLHTIRGGGGGPGRCDGHPTFAEIRHGCLSHVGSGPNLRSASLAVGDDDVVRVAFVAQNSTDPLIVAERPIGGAAFDHPITLVETFRYVDAFAMVDRGGRRLVAYSSDDGIVLATWNGATYAPTIATTDSGPLMGDVRKAMIDDRGVLRLIVGAEGRTDHWYETPSGVFAKMSVPEESPFAQVTDIHVTPSGKLHTLFNTGYGVYDGARWELTDLSSYNGLALAVVGEGPRRLFVSYARTAGPSVALLTLADDAASPLAYDGVAGYEIVSGVKGVGTDNFAEAWTRSAFAIGPRGELAYTFDGSLIRLRAADGPTLPLKVKLGISFTPGGVPMHVTSRDGVFDCTEDCEREVTAGTRVILDFETEGQVFGSCDGGVQSGRGLVCEVWIGSDDKVLSFTARESAAGTVWRVGSAEVPTVVERIATGGDRYALTGTMTDGRIAVGETIIEADGSGQTPMVAVVGQTGGWASAVPAHASALAVRADGGLSAVFIIDDVQTIGAQTVGTADEMTLMRARFDADGAVTEVDSLLTAHRSLKVLAAALAADGSGYLVGSASSAIAAPTLAAGTWVLRVAADGSVAGEMLAADLYGGAWHLAADGARAIVTTGQGAQAEFHRIEGASIVARSTLANAYVTAVALDGETIAALVQTQNSGLDFGDGLENGQTFVVTLDDALAVTGYGAMVAPIVPTAAVYGLTFDGGALVALIGDAIVRLDDHLGVAARTALPWAHQVRVQSASPHDGGVAFLFQTIAPLVEFDGLDIAGQGTRAIVDLDAP